MDLEDQLLPCSFTDVLSSILLLHLFNDQQASFAFGLKGDVLAGGQQLPILVPFHLRLHVRHLTAEGGLLGESGLHLPLDRLLVAEGLPGLVLWKRLNREVWAHYDCLYC